MSAEVVQDSNESHSTLVAEQIRKEFAGRLKMYGATTNLIMQIRARVRKYIIANDLQDEYEPYVRITQAGIVVSVREK